ncbi:MAG: helix-turn-helix domain-containing protein [Myxococcota bacterium]|nr:helix-turn-helix domain-containing protein [Myxococcota bacterium]
MSHIVIATQDVALRAEVIEPLADTGHAVQATPDWDGLVRAAADPQCTMVLVDSDLSQLDAELLHHLTESMRHKPLVRVLRGSAPPLVRVSSRRDLLLGQLRRLTPASLDQKERRFITHMGLGRKPFRKLARLSTHTLSVRIEGERGTNKEAIARALHALAGSSGPFVKLRDRDTSVPTGPEGTLYLKNIDAWKPEDLEELSRELTGRSWRLIGGSRVPLVESDSPVSWTLLKLPPLRERQRDIKSLAKLYLNQYCTQLGMPRKKLDPTAWALLHQYDWPGNMKELEQFLVRLLTSTRRSIIRRRDIPREVRSLIQTDPHAEIRDLAQGFEEMVEARLRPIVQEYEIDSELGLYRLTLDATERALLRLALARTGGNQKAAANLLGVAINTLRTKTDLLGLTGDDT